MAFALTSAQCYKLDTPNATKNYGLQVIELTVTRGAADVLLDLGNISGTFWTAVRADATYGVYATAVSGALAPCLVSIDRLVSFSMLGSGGPFIQVTALTASEQFLITNGSVYPAFSPIFTVDAGSPPAELKILAIFSLTDLVSPIEFT